MDGSSPGLDPSTLTYTFVSQGRLRLAAVGVLGAVVACSAAGLLLDRLLLARRAPASKPPPRGGGGGGGRLLPGWVIGMVLSSYALLVPGVLSKLFQSRTDLVIFGLAQNVSTYDETMVSLVRRSIREGMVLGGLLVALYAMVLPLCKLVLLVLAEVWHRAGGSGVRRARACVGIVRGISKWACPDMFAYILMMYLLRGLNKPPELRSNMELDLGFTCFCVFCVGSTVSSLGIRLPDLQPPPEQQAQRTEEDPAAAVELAAAKSVTRATTTVAVEVRPPPRSPRSAAVAVAVLAVAFSVLLALGITRPSMSMHLDMQLFYERNPTLEGVRGIIDALNLEVLLQTQVSLWECIGALCGWIAAGEVNAFIALVLYAGFALLVPVVDMSVVLGASLLGLQDLQANPDTAQLIAAALSLSRKLRKVSMLDVSIVGCLVVVAALMSMQDKGVVVKACSGTFFLAGAELCHVAAASIACRTLSAPMKAAASAATSVAKGAEMQRTLPVVMSAGDGGSDGTSMEQEDVESATASELTI